MGSVFLYSVGYVILTVVTLMIKLMGLLWNKYESFELHFDRVDKIYNVISKKLFFSSIIIFILESYMQTSISTIIHLTNV